MSCQIGLYLSGGPVSVSVYEGRSRYGWGGRRSCAGWQSRSLYHFRGRETIAQQRVRAADVVSAASNGASARHSANVELFFERKSRLTYHIIIGRQLDVEATAAAAREGLRPRHAMVDLASALDARVHHPDGIAVSVADTLRGHILGRPEAWALARQLAGKAIVDGDVVYCTGEDVGIPIASVCAARKVSARVAVFVHNLDRPRSRFGLRAYRSAGNITLFIACSRHQTDFLAGHLRVPAERLAPVWDSIDMQFFTPGPPRPAKLRPLIVAAGLEKRDYRTLAAATRDLDVDVRITGFSNDAKLQGKAFPEELPPNMKQNFYEWPDLVQLYRDADVVVVSTFPTTYAAGVQSLMEGMSCGRPIVATSTQGLKEYVSDPETVLAVEPGNAAEMQGALKKILADPAFASELAQRGRTQALERFNQDRYVVYLEERLRALG